MSQETLNQLDAQLDADTVEAIPVPAPNDGVPGQLAGGGGNAPDPLRMGAVLRLVTMRRLWYAQIVSTFGDFLALFAVITYMTFRLHTTPQQKTGIARILADMKEGAGFILHHAGLLFVIVALAAGMFVVGCFGPLIAVYVRDVLHELTKTYSIVSAMIGFGLLIGVNALNTFAKRMSNTLQVYLGLGGIALGCLFLAAIPTVATTILGCFLIGFSAAGIIVPSQTPVQQETPAELMGRVGSTLLSAIFTAQILGLVLSGILAEHTSIRRVFGLCTAMLATLIVVGKRWMEPAEHPALT